MSTINKLRNKVMYANGDEIMAFDKSCNVMVHPSNKNMVLINRDAGNQHNNYFGFDYRNVTNMRAQNREEFIRVLINDYFDTDIQVVVAPPATSTDNTASRSELTAIYDTIEALITAINSDNSSDAITTNIEQLKTEIDSTMGDRFDDVYTEINRLRTETTEYISNTSNRIDDIGRTLIIIAICIVLVLVVGFVLMYKTL